MLIAILNQSTLFTDPDASTMTAPIAHQVRFDAAPLWDRSAAAVIFYTDAKQVPAGAHGIAIVDTIKNQTEGVLGFHTEDQAANCGRSCRRTRINNRDKVTTGDWSVSSVLSQEVLEMYLGSELQSMVQQRQRCCLTVSRCAILSRPRPTTCARVYPPKGSRYTDASDRRVWRWWCEGLQALVPRRDPHARGSRFVAGSVAMPQGMDIGGVSTGFGAKRHVCQGCRLDKEGVRDDVTSAVQSAPSVATWRDNGPTAQILGFFAIATGLPGPRPCGDRHD